MYLYYFSIFSEPICRLDSVFTLAIPPTLPEPVVSLSNQNPTIPAASAFSLCSYRMVGQDESHPATPRPIYNQYKLGTKISQFELFEIE